MDHRKLASETALADVLATLERDDADGVAALDRLIEDHPSDARLHFIRGSTLAGMRLYAEGRASIAHAVELEPAFHLARYQLGFLDFTSGNPTSAADVWAPLEDAAGYLSMFVRGLNALARDDFDGARHLLEEGVSLNEDNGPLNSDIRMIIAEIEQRVTMQDQPALSPTQMLLDQSRFSTRH